MEVLEALLLSLLFIASVLSIFRRLPWPTQHNKPTEAPPKDTSKAANKGGEEEMKKVFSQFDKNKDGFITKQELGESLRQMGISAGEDDDDEVGQMMTHLDSNGDGLIDLGEFSGIFDKTCRGDDEEDEEGELREAFDVFDGDRDGLITVEELKVVLGAMGIKEGEREESCREMIRKVDEDGDGMVSFHEFKRMMKSKTSYGSGGVRLVPAF